MNRAKVLQEIRTMRFEEVYERWTESRLTQREAAELLGVGERQFRRQCRRYESDGLEGLIDQRLGQLVPQSDSRSLHAARNLYLR